MRIILILFSVITCLQSLHAQSKTLAQLHLLNTQFIQSFIHKDTVIHNKIIHPAKFVFIDVNGVPLDRDRYVKKGPDWYDTSAYRDFRLADENINLSGSTAVVTAKTAYMVFKGNYWAAEETRYEDTYIKEHGRWWCVQVQLTKIGL